MPNNETPECCTPTVYPCDFYPGDTSSLAIDDCCDNDECRAAAVRAYHDGVKNAEAEGV